MSVLLLEWRGEAVERAFRRRRPQLDLPWGTLRPSDYHPELLRRARIGWTDGAFAEFSTAGQLAALLEGLVRVRAPLDLIGAVGDFVSDEMFHAELHARVLQELGGAVPYDVDDALLTHAIPPTSEHALRDVVIAAVRTCCIGESLSVPLLGASRAVAAHPLIEGVLVRLAADEGPHAQLGWWVLEWAAPRLSADDRAAIGTVAAREIASLEAMWQAPTSEVRDGRTSEGFDLAEVHALGWLDSATWVERARTVVQDRIAPRLREALAA